MIDISSQIRQRHTLPGQAFGVDSIRFDSIQLAPIGWKHLQESFQTYTINIGIWWRSY